MVFSPSCVIVVHPFSLCLQFGWRDVPSFCSYPVLAYFPLCCSFFFLISREHFLLFRGKTLTCKKSFVLFFEFPGYLVSDFPFVLYFYFARDLLFWHLG